jgi:hypothetical protein
VGNCAIGKSLAFFFFYGARRAAAASRRLTDDEVEEAAERLWLLKISTKDAMAVLVLPCFRHAAMPPCRDSPLPAGERGGGKSFLRKHKRHSRLNGAWNRGEAQILVFRPLATTNLRAMFGVVFMSIVAAGTQPQWPQIIPGVCVRYDGAMTAMHT